MSEHKEIFVDGVGKIGLMSGAVRCELVSLTATKEGEQPQVNNSLNLVMTPQGLLQIVGNLQNFVNQMKEKGILVEKPRDADGAAGGDVSNISH